jgi:chemotaxis protein MotB
MQKKIEDAMADFKDKGVDVYYKDWFVYVDMSDKLLYKSGSAVLGAEGKKAIGALANALNGYPNLKVIVLGNTDDKPIKQGGDKWSLSTERANGVVRILADDQVNPARLTAGGKGKYPPIADNSTEEGRAKNRRTEIILNPDLDKLW